MCSLLDIKSTIRIPCIRQGLNNVLSSVLDLEKVAGKGFNLFIIKVHIIHNDNCHNTTRPMLGATAEPFMF